MNINKRQRIVSLFVVLILLSTVVSSVVGSTNVNEIHIEGDNYSTELEEDHNVQEDINVESSYNSKTILSSVSNTDDNESDLESFRSLFMRQLYEILSRFLDNFPGLASTPFFSALLDWLNNSQDPDDVDDTIPPFQVTGLSVTDAKDGKLDLSWNPATDNIGVDHYCVYRGGILIADDLELTTYLDSGLINGISYTYHVSAVDAAGNEGELSDAVDGISTEIILDDTTPPSKVTGLTVTDAKDGKLDLSWNPATDNVGVDHYNIYQDGSFLVDVATTSYLNTGLVDGETYTYQISAVDSSENEGKKSTSNSGTPTESDTTPPSQVTGLTVTDAKDGKLDLSWNPATDNIEIDHYNVYRDSLLIVSVVTKSYLDTGLTNGETYTYQISAVDSSENEGEKSTSESGIPTEEGSGDDGVIFPKSGHIAIIGNGYMELDTAININDSMLVTLIGSVYLSTGMESIDLWWNLSTGFLEINASAFSEDGDPFFQLDDFVIEIREINATDSNKTIKFSIGLLSIDASGHLVLLDEGGEGSLELAGMLEFNDIEISASDFAFGDFMLSCSIDMSVGLDGNMSISWNESGITIPSEGFEMGADVYLDIQELLFTYEDVVHLSASQILIDGGGYLTVADTIKAEVSGYLGLSGFWFRSSSLSVSMQSLSMSGEASILLTNSHISLNATAGLDLIGFSFSSSGISFSIGSLLAGGHVSVGTTSDFSSLDIFATGGGNANSISLNSPGISLSIGSFSASASLDIHLHSSLSINAGGSVNIGSLHVQAGGFSLSLDWLHASGGVSLSVGTHIYVSGSAVITMTGLHLSSSEITANVGSIGIGGAGHIFLGDYIDVSASGSITVQDAACNATDISVYLGSLTIYSTAATLSITGNEITVEGEGGVSVNNLCVDMPGLHLESDTISISGVSGAVYVTINNDGEITAVSAGSNIATITLQGVNIQTSFVDLSLSCDISFQGSATVALYNDNIVVNVGGSGIIDISYLFASLMGIEIQAESIYTSSSSLSISVSGSVSSPTITFGTNEPLSISYLNLMGISLTSIVGTGSIGICPTNNFGLGGSGSWSLNVLGLAISFNGDIDLQIFDFFALLGGDISLFRLNGNADIFSTVVLDLSAVVYGILVIQKVETVSLELNPSQFAFDIILGKLGGMVFDSTGGIGASIGFADGTVISALGNGGHNEINWDFTDVDLGDLSEGSFSISGFSDGPDFSFTYSSDGGTFSLPVDLQGDFYIIGEWAFPGTGVGHAYFEGSCPGTVALINENTAISTKVQGHLDASWDIDGDLDGHLYLDAEALAELTIVKPGFTISIVGNVYAHGNLEWDYDLTDGDIKLLPGFNTLDWGYDFYVKFKFGSDSWHQIWPPSDEPHVTLYVNGHVDSVTLSPNEYYQFTAFYVPKNPDNEYNYTFTFGDGEQEIVQTSDAVVTVEHNYTNIGSYAAQIQVIDGTSTYEDTVDVTVEMKYLKVSGDISWYYDDIQGDGRLYGNFTVKNLGDESSGYQLLWDVIESKLPEWINIEDINPSSGTLSPESSQTVEVSVELADVYQSYSGSIKIINLNDEDETGSVPVSYNYGYLSVKPAEWNINNANEGEERELYPVRVQNTRNYGGESVEWEVFTDHPEWQWSLPAGGTLHAGLEDIVTIYLTIPDNNPHTANITFRNKNDYNEFAIIEVTITPESCLPVAIINTSYAGFKGKSIGFDASESYDPDGGSIVNPSGIVKYAWKWGDQGNEEWQWKHWLVGGATPTHVYGNVGEYTLQLMVQDNEGNNSKIVNAIITVTKSSLLVEPTQWNPGLVEPGSTLHKNFTITNVGDTDLDWEVDVDSLPGWGESWNFVPQSGTLSPGGSRNMQISVTVPDSNWDILSGGIRIWNLNNHDDFEVISMSAITPIEKYEPIVIFNGEPYSGMAAQSIAFDASGSYDPDGGNIIKYGWQFGDEIIPHWHQLLGSKPSHTYSQPGTYAVKVRVWDDELQCAIKNATVTVEEPELSLSISAPVEDTTFAEWEKFSVTVKDQDDNPILAYVTFNGRTLQTNAFTGRTVGKFCAPEVSEDWKYYDIYTWKVLGNYDGDLITIKVEDSNDKPIADAGGPYLNYVAGDEILFDGSASSDDGDIVSYSWNFGDGNTGTGETTTHTFSHKGTYIISLTVTDDEGVEDNDAAVAIVLPDHHLSIMNPVDGSSIDEGESFYITVVDQDNAPIAAWVDFNGDVRWLAFGTSVFPFHAPEVSGDKTYEINAWKLGYGENNSAVVVEDTESGQPDADAGGPYVGDIGDSIPFDGSGSRDPDGTIVSYEWDFGDGHNAVGETVTHSYSSIGAYVATLTVTDNNGNEDEATVTVNIEEPSGIEIIAPSSVDENEIFYVSIEQDGNPVYASVSFNGETKSGSTVSFTAPDSPDPHIYRTITAEMGGEDKSKLIEIVNTDDEDELGASFIYLPANPTIDDTIQFTDTSDGDIVSYSWNFGDGATSNLQNPTHGYDAVGQYTVTLTVTGNDEATDADTTSVSVSDGSSTEKPPVANAGELYTGIEDQSISFDASDSYDPNGDVLQYRWDWTNDGIWDYPGAIGWSDSPTASHVYSEDGGYTVKLQVREKYTLLHRKDTDTAGVTVQQGTTIPPVAIIGSNVEDNSPYAMGDTFTCDAVGSYDSDGLIVEYYWTFGDGTDGYGEFIEKSYSSPGGFTITLTVTDDDGLTDFDTADITIEDNLNPVVFMEAYMWNVDDSTWDYVGNDQAEVDVIVGRDVRLYPDASDPDGSIVRHRWDFDSWQDGEPPDYKVYTWGSAGYEVVRITVEDNQGATEYTDVHFEVVEEPTDAPVAEAGGPYSGNPGDSIAFDASGSYDPNGDALQYKWDWNNDGIYDYPVIGWSNVPTASHSWSNEGDYTVRVKVRERFTLLHRSDTDTAGVTITNVLVPPVAVIGSNVEDNSPYEMGETFHCDAFESYDSDGDIVSYSWNFGDGDTATGDFVEHSYSTPGDYTITLTVEDDDGLTDTDTAFVTVNNNLNPEVLLEVYMLSGDGTTWEYKGNSDDPEVDVFVGRSIKFDPKYPTNTYDPDGDIEQYRWYAHDNGGYGPWESGHPSPRIYSWSSTGYHGVRLDVKDDDGAQNNADVNLHVISPPPGTIKGKVYKSGGGVLSGATVSTDGDSDTTGFLGNYELTVDPGLHIVTASKSGYQSDSQTVSVDPDETVNNVNFYLELNNNPPSLLSGSVNPGYGDTSTTFDYYITYTDPDGDAPTMKYVYIDGSSHTMTKLSGSYTSGTTYRYSTKLLVGTHSYYFYFSDGQETARWPTSGTKTGPTVSPPVGSWVTANGHSPSSGWDDEQKARDGNTGSSAESEKFMLIDEGWTDWLTLTISPQISCSKVRYYALYSSTYITKIDIEVYYSSGWHNIYTGSFANKNWQSRLLGGTYTVSKAKVRFYVKGAWNGGEGITAELFEFQFWDTGA